MFLGEVSYTLEEFLSVCCIFGPPDEGTTKCERVIDVQFFESYTSIPFIKSSEGMCLSCRGSWMCKVHIFKVLDFLKQVLIEGFLSHLPLGK